jgi:hypothetical protein
MRTAHLKQLTPATISSGIQRSFLVFQNTAFSFPALSHIYHSSQTYRTIHLVETPTYNRSCGGLSSYTDNFRLWLRSPFVPEGYLTYNLATHTSKTASNKPASNTPVHFIIFLNIVSVYFYITKLPQRTQPTGTCNGITNT